MAHANTMKGVIQARTAQRPALFLLGLVILALSASVIEARMTFRRSAFNRRISKQVTPNDYKTRLSAVTIPAQGEYGFITVDGNGNDFFYLLYPPQKGDPKTAPLLIWLSGGPGCASTMAMLYENGPIMLDSNKNAVVNPYSWNENAWLLFVDQPIGTGFGHGTVRDIPLMEAGVQNNFLTFLTNFYQKFSSRFNQATTKLFLSGESYAGHYLPAISNKLFNYPSAAANGFNLNGVAIGNGWVSPQNQVSAYNKFALENGLIDQATFNQLAPQFEVCEYLYQTNPPLFKNMYAAFCNIPFSTILLDPTTGQPKFSYYNINDPCYGWDCVNVDAEIAYLGTPQVVTAFQVDQPYLDCSDPVYNTLAREDLRTDAAPYLQDLLEAGIPILAYNGDLDFICNWESGVDWTNKLAWKDQASFQAAPMTPYNMNGDDTEPVGARKTFGSFTFLRFFNAGHMVPHDMPEQSLYMINDFMGFIPAPPAKP